VSLRANESVGLELTIDLIGVVASQDFSRLLHGSLVLAVESLVALGAARSCGNSSGRTVVSLQAGVLASELSVEETVETTRAGLESCGVVSITVFAYGARLASFLLSKVLVGTSFTVDLVNNTGRALVTLSASY